MLVLVFHVSWQNVWLRLSLRQMTLKDEITAQHGCGSSTPLSRLLMTVQVMIAFFLNESLEVYFTDPSKPATWHSAQCDCRTPLFLFPLAESSGLLLRLKPSCRSPKSLKSSNTLAPLPELCSLCSSLLWRILNEV